MIWLDLLFGLALVATILGVIFRFGLFAGMAAFFVHFWTYNIPTTLTTSRLYFQMSLFVLGLVVAMAAIGFSLARGGTQRRDLSASR